jgi:hypothetical protein
MSLKGLIAALDVARAAMKTIPGLGTQLEGGVEVVLLLCKHAEVQRSAVNFIPADALRI